MNQSRVRFPHSSIHLLCMKQTVYMNTVESMQNEESGKGEV